MKINYCQQRIICAFSALSVVFSSCNNTDEASINNGLLEETKNAVLIFTSKEDIINAINSEAQVQTRAITTNYITGELKETSDILSLTDKVLPNDPILKDVSEDEKNIIIEEGMTYYDLYGCEDYIPSENFAKLLNSKCEIQLNDSVYKITEFGTLRASAAQVEELEIAYKKLKEDTTFVIEEEEGDERFIPITDDAEFLPFEKIKFEDESTLLATTRTTSSELPTNNFKHYSSKSKTVLGKALGGIFGDKSVKHHEFIKNRRVNGSLYSYNYGLYHETGCFVSMSKKRGGFFKFINGWKDIQADELFVQYRGIVLELNLDVPKELLPTPPTNKKPEIMSFSDVKIQGIDYTFHNTVDILGYNVKEKDLYKYIGIGAKQAYNYLKNAVGNPNSLEHRLGADKEVTSMRIITPDKVYFFIHDLTDNPKNKKKKRYVFNAGVKLVISINTTNPSWSDFFKSLQETQKLPIKKLCAGEVLLAGKLDNHWGGMFITKKWK